MARFCCISLTLCFLLFHGCVSLTQAYGRTQDQQLQDQCQLHKLKAVEPSHKMEGEGGLVEYWEENSKQFDCAGIAAFRHTIQPKGLLLPQYSNQPKLTYIVEGRGIQGTSLPGCPGTYQFYRQQSKQSQYGEGQQYEDWHQKIKDLRKGDIVAMPSGVVHWFYNDGDKPLIMVTVHHTANSENNLDQSRRAFFLAGNVKRQEAQQHEGSKEEKESQSQSSNIFQEFDDRILADVFRVSRETARKLKSENDRRGIIIRLETGLQLVRPPRTEQEEAEQQGQQQESMGSNGLEQTICTMRYRENIGEPIRADIFNPQGGRLRSINSGTLPILKQLQLSAERGVLYSNALMTPHWNMNADSVIYVTKGTARVQVVGNYQTPVFDGEIREGQLLIVPQNFAVVKQAGNNGFEWVAFKTNDNAMTTPVAGKTSALAAMPLDVLINAYQGLTREEAIDLKNSRGWETMILAPSSTSQKGDTD